MCCLFLLLVFGLTLSAYAQNIIVVAESSDLNEDGVVDDYRLVEVLEEEGYTVDIQRDYWMELDDDKINALNAADLVIISRNTGSGNYNQAPEVTQWNSVTTPMILSSSWFVRNNRWMWLNIGETIRYGGSPTLEATDTRHPVFAGVTLDENNQIQALDPNVSDGQTTFVDIDDVGNGLLIARTADNNYPFIVEWDEGVEFYNGSGEFAGGRRLFFSFGTQENEPKTSPMGAYNFTPEGEKIFLNAIHYMLGGAPRLTAYAPKPATDKTEVPQDTVLSWKSGIYAHKHDVYFGTAYDDVNEASRDNPLGVLVSQEQEDNIYAPVTDGLLDFGKTYYWRVDEVNAPPDSTIRKGDIWSFAVINYHVVDDFEDYNDYAPSRIFDIWIDGYGTTTNGSTVGYAEPDFSAGEHFMETEIVHGGDQSMPYFYDNDMKYSEAVKTLDSARDWTLDGVQELSLWFRGLSGYVGSFTEEPAGTYTMTATGTDIWESSDEFHFAYKELTGVGSVIAKIESVEQTDAWAKAGVMIRNSLDAEARHAMVVVTPAQGVSFQRRTITGSASAETTEADITAPQWVKIERDLSGNFIGSYSADGVSWTQIGVDSINMNATTYVGLVVTAHNPIEVCEAVLSNVSITGTVSDQWMNQDIGIASNAPQPMYAVVGNNTGDPVVFYHEDPNATVISSWTEWTIPLQDFADQGINLTDVDNIAIGIGTKGDTTSPGGSGQMFFDNIRLYKNIE
jgi:hypothetical protein